MTADYSSFAWRVSKREARGSVPRASGFVQVGNPEKWPIASDVRKFRRGKKILPSRDTASDLGLAPRSDGAARSTVPTALKRLYVFGMSGFNTLDADKFYGVPDRSIPLRFLLIGVGGEKSWRVYSSQVLPMDSTGLESIGTSTCSRQTVKWHGIGRPYAVIRPQIRKLRGSKLR
jgi:hypothetical protein